MEIDVFAVFNIISFVFFLMVAAVNIIERKENIEKEKELREKFKDLNKKYKLMS